MASKCDCCAVRVQIVVIVMIAMTGQLMAINRKLDSSSIGLNIERSNKLLTPNMLPLSEDDAESKGRNWIGNLPSTISFNPRFNRDAGIDPDSDPQLLKDLVDQWLNGQNFLRKEQFFVDRVNPMSRFAKRRNNELIKYLLYLEPEVHGPKTRKSDDPRIFKNLFLGARG